MSAVIPFSERSSKGRSAVTNGKRLFVDGDSTGPWGRRLRDIVEMYIEHLGGRAEAGVARLAIVRRVATIEISLEKMEGTASEKPEQLDIDTYQRTANTHRRLLETLGLNSKVRIVNNPIMDHFSRPPQRGDA